MYAIALTVDENSIGSGLLELKEAVVGIQAQIAQAAIEADMTDEEKANIAPIVSKFEISGSSTVSSRLKIEAEREGTPKDLGEKVRAEKEYY